jgi:DEAD/DEAH box helicase domain-containing protein
MQPPNYSSLLNEFLSHYQQPITVIETLEDNNNTATDIVEFLGEELLWNEIIPAQTPNLEQLPKTLPKPLKKALKQMGINQLYSHQIKTLKAIRAGYDVILSTNTASGKTLSAYIPVIEGIINHNYRAISFYGLKALTSDQGQKLTQLIDLIPLTYQPKLAILNGDIPIQEREQLLAKNPDIIGATPELIHYALKGTYWSEPWQQFLQHLRYIIIDEAHTFTGAYGANMANLIQRIKLAVDHYGGNSQQLQFIFLSATIGNPKQLAQRLSNRPQTQQEKPSLIGIKNSGASAPQRQLIVTKPSHNPNPDTAKIILFLLSQGLSGICFCQGRITIKNLLTTLKTEANNQNYWGIEQQIAIFYGGLTNERRQTIIEQLKTGQIRCILSTSALEAGIDLAALDFVDYSLLS